MKASWVERKLGLEPPPANHPEWKGTLANITGSPKRSRQSAKEAMSSQHFFFHSRKTFELKGVGEGNSGGE